jgi:hypothetical protein
MRISITAAELAMLAHHHTITMTEGHTITVAPVTNRRETHPLYMAAAQRARELVEAGEAAAELSISAAARQVGVHYSVVTHWKNRGYCPTVGKDKNRVLVRLVDVLYCYAVYSARGGISGPPLLAPDGLPFEGKPTRRKKYQ